MGNRKFKEFKHIALNQNDLGLLASPKTLLCKANLELYTKLRVSLDAFDFRNMGMLSDEEKNMFMNGGAIMFHIMTNPEFLKECKNIYGQEESKKTDCVVCGSSYPNLKKDSDTCYECRKKYE